MAKIKDLPKHKRPREKLAEKGAENLSDAELLLSNYEHNKMPLEEINKLKPFETNVYKF